MAKRKNKSKDKQESLNLDNENLGTPSDDQDLYKTDSDLSTF